MQTNKTLRTNLLLSLAVVALLLAPFIPANADYSFKWTKSSQGRINDAVAINDTGTIYVFEGYPATQLTAYKPDGSVKWRFDEPGGSTGGSAPTVGSDGTIYAGGSDGYLYAVNPDGTEKWRVDLGTKTGASSPALSEDGILYMGGNNGDLIAISSTGSIQWRISTGSAVTSSPAITPDGTILFGSTNGTFYAVNPDGTVQWTYDTNGGIRSDPAVAGSGEIYFHSKDGRLYALNPDGSKKWSYSADNTNSCSDCSPPVIGQNGTIYFWESTKTLVALNPDGSVAWKVSPTQQRPTENRPQIQPAIAKDGTIMAVRRLKEAGTLIPISPSGSILDQLRFDGNGSSGPAIAPDGTVVFGTANWNFQVLAAESDAGRLAKSSWPTFQADNQNTGRAAETCTQEPTLHVFPGHLKLNHGSVLVFVEGFKESNRTVSAIDPSTVTFAEAKPEWWLTVPPLFFGRSFTILKFRRDNLKIDESVLSPRKWTRTKLKLAGSFEDSGCFEGSKTVKVRP